MFIFMTVVGVYFAFAFLVVAPVYARYEYMTTYAKYLDEDGNFKTYSQYGSDYQYTHEEVHEKATENLIGNATFVGFFWPIVGYGEAIRYFGAYPKIKEQNRRASQRQAELNLERAKAIVAKAREDAETNWDKKFEKMDKISKGA